MSSGKRRWSRIQAVQLLYQQEKSGTAAGEILAAFRPLDFAPPDELDGDQRPSLEVLEAAEPYARQIFSGVGDNGEQIDEVIRSHSQNWRLERMPAVDRNILRVAVYELLFERDVPQAAILDEAIEIAKLLAGEDSGSFVNGVLDAIVRTVELPGTLR